MVFYVLDSGLWFMYISVFLLLNMFLVLFTDFRHFSVGPLCFFLHYIFGSLASLHLQIVPHILIESYDSLKLNKTRNIFCKMISNLFKLPYIFSVYCQIGFNLVIQYTVQMYVRRSVSITINRYVVVNSFHGIPHSIWND